MLLTTYWLGWSSKYNCNCLLPNQSWKLVIHPRKFNSSPLKNTGWKTNYILSFWVPLHFQGLFAVKLQVGNDFIYLIHFHFEAKFTKKKHKTHQLWIVCCSLSLTNSPISSSPLAVENMHFLILLRVQNSNSAPKAIWYGSTPTSVTRPRKWLRSFTPENHIHNSFSIKFILVILLMEQILLTSWYDKYM